MSGTTAQLGQLLVQNDWVPADGISAALANQLTYGGRLGTNLIELGILALDRVGEALAHQHGVQLATVALLEASTPEIRRLVRADFCAAKGVFPLGYRDNTLHLAMLDPQRAGELQQLMRANGTKVVGYAVPQLRLLYYLERCYNIPRAKRYLRMSDGTRRNDDRRSYLAPTVSSQPDFSSPNLTGPIRAPQATPALTGPVQIGIMRPRPAAAPEPEPELNLEDELVYLDQVVRDRGRKSDVDIDVDIDICFDEDDRISAAEAHTVDAALEQLESATTRDEVVQCLVRPVFAEASLNVVFMPRGELGVAVAAWGTEVTPPRVGALVVPLNIPSLLKRAIDSRVALCGRGEDSLQEMIAVYLRTPPPKQTCIAPVFIAGTLSNLLCTQTAGELPASAVSDITRLVQGAELAFARLLAQVAPT